MQLNKSSGTTKAEMTGFVRLTKLRSHHYTAEVREAVVAKNPRPLTFEDGYDDEQLVRLGDHDRGGGVCRKEAE